LLWSAPLERQLFKNATPFTWPPAKTTLVQFLQEEIALTPGDEFRGRVANIAGQGLDPTYIRYPFVNQHNYDAFVAFFADNDHDQFGLWYYNIPTLVESNQFSSPFFHAVTSRFLTQPNILHTRPQTTLTEYNSKVFGALGVKYVLTEKPIDNLNPVFTYEVTEGRQQNIFEIKSPNTSGYSPQHLYVADTIERALKMMKEPEFDFQSEAIVHEQILSKNSHIAPIQRSRITFLKNGLIKISAAAKMRSAKDYSDKKSFLVLPIEYSNCFKIRENNLAKNIKMVRTNINQLGILFSDQIELILEFKTGPWVNASCRLQDKKDADKLKLGELAKPVIWP